MSKKVSSSVAQPLEKPLMHVQVTTDATIHAHEEVMQRFVTESRHVLSRFAHQIMNVEVHFTDENGVKHGNGDKRCLIEVRCSGRPPVAVSDKSSTIESSFHGAAKKLLRLLESSLGKVEEHKGGETIRAENLVD